MLPATRARTADCRCYAFSPGRYALRCNAACRSTAFGLRTPPGAAYMPLDKPARAFRWTCCWRFADAQYLDTALPPVVAHLTTPRLTPAFNNHHDYARFVTRAHTCTAGSATHLLSRLLDRLLLDSAHRVTFTGCRLHTRFAGAAYL